MVERHGERRGREAHEPAFTIRANAGGLEPGGFVWQREESDVSELDVWNNRPATTVPGGSAVIAEPGRSEFVKGGVSRQNRPGSVKVTVEEAAALQTYPPEFRFAGGKGKQYLQVGNAVPPMLARAVLEALWAEPVADELDLAA